MNYALENHIEEIIKTEGYKFPVLARENKSSAKGFYDTRRFPVHQFLAVSESLLESEGSYFGADHLLPDAHRSR